MSRSTHARDHRDLRDLRDLRTAPREGAAPSRNIIAAILVDAALSKLL
jgi:hypothetical protein